MLYHVKVYINKLGKCPFNLWVRSLDSSARIKIESRLIRFAEGNFGDVKSVGDGIWEARIHSGPGYRLYFGKSDGRLILLLAGGDKSTQEKDIKKAKEYWNDFKENGNG